jgi:hypothetical protein
MSFTRIPKLGIPVLLLMAAIGCHGSDTTASTSMATPQKAVLITTGNGTSYVVLPTTDGNGVQRLAADGTPAPACKQCEDDALAYFKTGVISPKCPTCGASRIPVHSVN